VILGHAIALDPTPEQRAHFRRACGTARYAYNWGLAEWKRMREVGEKPSANKVKKRWNAHRKAELPWSYDVTKCASGQAIMDLGAAFSNFFRDCKKPKKQRHFRHPQFKRKTLNESFALWNDQFDITGKRVDIAKLGVVKMREELRFLGKIVAATVSFRGGRWFLSVQVETFFCRRPAPEGSVAGIDLGSRTLATVAETDNEDEVEAVPNPKPRERLLGRVRRRQRRIDWQKHRAKRAGQKKGSRRQYIRQLRLSRLQARLANIRKDAAHKLTADRTRRSRTNVIEDLMLPAWPRTTAWPAPFWTAALAKSGGSFNTRHRFATGESWLPTGSSRQRKPATSAALSAVLKAKSRWTLSAGFARTAAPRTVVTRTRQ
jgi:putative transposase